MFFLPRIFGNLVNRANLILPFFLGQAKPFAVSNALIAGNNLAGFTIRPVIIQAAFRIIRSQIIRCRYTIDSFAAALIHSGLVGIGIINGNNTFNLISIHLAKLQVIPLAARINVDSCTAIKRYQLTTATVGVSNRTAQINPAATALLNIFSYDSSGSRIIPRLNLVFILMLSIVINKAIAITDAIVRIILIEAVISFKLAISLFNCLQLADILVIKFNAIIASATLNSTVNIDACRINIDSACSRDTIFCAAILANQSLSDLQSFRSSRMLSINSYCLNKFSQLFNCCKRSIILLAGILVSNLVNQCLLDSFYIFLLYGILRRTSNILNAVTVALRNSIASS